MKNTLATTSPVIAFYVSGHGFGHARRTAQLLRTLTASRPDIRVIVRTAAPPFLFKDIANVTVSPPAELFDPGVVERDTLTIDPAASLARLADVLNRRDSIIATEAAFLRSISATLVVADIPFLAADAAHSAAVPALAVGNFTWDWIFEPYVDAAHSHLINQIRDSYAKMEAIFHLPLGHEVNQFRKVVEVPLLATPARQNRATTLAQLNLNPNDTHILIALRGGLAEQSLRQAAHQSPDLTFIINQPINNPPPNLRSINPSPQLDFSDLLAASDAVISKLGYGILSDCIANNTAILFPPRTGFREDEISRKVCPQYLRMREIDPQSFAQGDWQSALQTLLHQPPAPSKMPCDGDRIITRLLADRI